MPFISAEEQSNVSLVEAPNVISPIKKAPEPTTWQVAAAAFRQNNTIASAGYFLERGGPIGPREDFHYDSVTPLRKTKYEPYVEQFYDADSDADVQIIKNRIDAEEKDRKILAEGGGESVAWSLAAGVLDPTNFIPVAGWLAKGAAAVKVAKGAMQSSKALAGYAVKSAAVGAGSTTLSEIALQQTQEIRPIEESLTNIGTATILSGVLGGSIAGISKSTRAKVQRDLTIDDTPDGNIKASIDRAMEEVPAPTEKSLSAAAVEGKETLNDYEVAGADARLVVKANSKIAPEFSLMLSPVLAVRQLAEQLFNIPYLLNKHLLGKKSPISAENIIGLYNANASHAINSIKENYNIYKERLAKNGEKILSYNEFDERVSLALIKGDVDDIPEVQLAAQANRKHLYDPVLKEGQEAKVFPENSTPKNSLSYFPQRWDKAKIKANYHALRSLIIDRLPGVLAKDLARAKLVMSQANKIRKRLQKLKNVEGKAYKRLETELKGLEEKLDEFRISEAIMNDNTYGDIADQLIGGLLGQKESVIFNTPIPLTKGPLKWRKLDFINQEDLRPWLNNSAEQMAKSYARDVGPEITLRKMFGDIELKEQLQRINEAYAAEIAKTKSTKKVASLIKRQARDVEDIKLVVGRMRGTIQEASEADSAIAKFLWATRAMSFVSKFGEMTASSIVEIAKPILIKGLMPIVSDALIPMITNMKAIKMSAAEALEAGVACEVALSNNRALSMDELTNIPNFGGQFKRGLEFLQNKMTRYSLISHWDDARRKLTAVMAQNRMFEDIESLINGTIKEKDKADLAFLGIDLDVAKSIQKMRDDGFVEKQGNLFISNTKNWSDRNAAFAFLAALNKQVNQNAGWIGVGSKPRLMDGSWGKTILQGTSFAFAATSKVLVSGLQHKDMKLVSFITATVTLGMLQQAFKDIAAGRELSDKPADWLAAGIDNSGIFGILHTLNNRLANITNNRVRAGKMIGSEEPEFKIDPYREIGEFFGPSGGYLADILNPLTFLDGRDWSKRDTRALRRLIPFQNLIFFRKLFDLAEEGINQSLGVKNK